MGPLGAIMREASKSNLKLENGWLGFPVWRKGRDVVSGAAPWGSFPWDPMGTDGGRQLEGMSHSMSSRLTYS